MVSTGHVARLREQERHLLPAAPALARAHAGARQALDLVRVERPVLAQGAGAPRAHRGRGRTEIAGRLDPDQLAAGDLLALAREDVPSAGRERGAEPLPPVVVDARPGRPRGHLASRAGGPAPAPGRWLRARPPRRVPRGGPPPPRAPAPSRHARRRPPRRRRRRRRAGWCAARRRPRGRTRRARSGTRAGRPGSAASSTCGTSPMARHTVSQATSSSRPGINRRSPSSAARRTPSISSRLPSAAATTWPG